LLQPLKLTGPCLPREEPLCCIRFCTVRGIAARICPLAAARQYQRSTQKSRDANALLALMEN